MNSLLLAVQSLYPSNSDSLSLVLSTGSFLHTYAFMGQITSASSTLSSSLLSHTFASAFSGRLEGAGLDSRKITFHPGKGSHRTSYVADTKSAGSTALMLQISLPCLLFQPSDCTVELRGGTNAAHAPQFEYLQKVFAVSV